MPNTTGGPLALVGAGEYTAAMRETDALLLDAAGGRQGVALLPTASALEPGKPEEWNRKGVAHFAALGARTSPLLLLSREDAADPALVAELRVQDVFYFSGGDPEYLVATLRETPAWDAVTNAHAAGAAVAGCSAGAMMLGEYVLGVRALRQGRAPEWHPALGLARGLAVVPHFDQLRRFIDPATFATVLAAAPSHLTVVGVDEDTALVRLPADGGAWRVMGRGAVTVFRAGSEATAYGAGSRLALPIA